MKNQIHIEDLLKRKRQYHLNAIEICSVLKTDEHDYIALSDVENLQYSKLRPMVYVFIALILAGLAVWSFMLISKIAFGILTAYCIFKFYTIVHFQSKRKIKTN